tara:strand:+ start:466 stop:642 length:177 start_codon:yes stop_codon:yes gene_type:complete
MGLTDLILLQAVQGITLESERESKTIAAVATRATTFGRMRVQASLMKGIVADAFQSSY